MLCDVYNCPAADDRSERHGRILAELAEAGMAAVRKLSARLDVATSDVEHERLALSLHRMSRCVRLTIALEERLVHERRTAFREERADRRRAIEHRKEQVDYAVTGRIFAEREGEAAEALQDELRGLLGEEPLYEAFLDLPLEAVIARFCRLLDLTAEFPANDAAAALAAAPPPAARAGPS